MAHSQPQSSAERLAQCEPFTAALLVSLIARADMTIGRQKVQPAQKRSYFHAIALSV